MQNITPQDLRAWLDDAQRPDPVLLDVREQWEVDVCRIPESRHIAMRTIPERVAELDPAAQTVVICHHGGRSMQVAMFLERNGFASVYNLQGGVDGWARQVDPSMATY